MSVIAGGGGGTLLGLGNVDCIIRLRIGTSKNFYCRYQVPMISTI